MALRKVLDSEQVAAIGAGGGYAGTPTRVPAGTTRTLPVDVQEIVMLNQKIEGDQILDGDRVFV